MNKLNIKRSKTGYLKNLKDWNKKIALLIAKEEKLFITKNHWQVIFIMRNFYLKFSFIPSMRILNAEISKNNNKKISSIYLFTLFPKGPLTQGGKIAGLPQINKCL